MTRTVLPTWARACNRSILVHQLSKWGRVFFSPRRIQAVFYLGHTRADKEANVMAASECISWISYFNVFTCRSWCTSCCFCPIWIHGSSLTKDDFNDFTHMSILVFALSFKQPHFDLLHFFIFPCVRIVKVYVHACVYGREREGLKMATIHLKNIYDYHFQIYLTYLFVAQRVNFP